MKNIKKLFKDAFNYATSDTYEERVVGKFTQAGILISTAHVPDGQQPIETCIIHPEYGNSLSIIVEAYDTIEDAREGHEKWVGVMTSTELPDSLTDCANAAGIRLLIELGGEDQRPHFKRKQQPSTTQAIPSI